MKRDFLSGSNSTCTLFHTWSLSVCSMFRGVLGELRNSASRRAFCCRAADFETSPLFLVFFSGEMARAPMRSDVPIIAVICILIGDRGAAAPRHPPAEPRPPARLATRRTTPAFAPLAPGGEKEGVRGARKLGWLTQVFLAVGDSSISHTWARKFFADRLTIFLVNK